MKLKIFISLAIALLISSASYYFYPRTYLSIGIRADQDDTTKFFIESIKWELQKNGIDLRYEVQNQSIATDPISFLQSNPKVDFVLHGNFGEALDNTNEVTSIGIVLRQAILFFKNPKSQAAQPIKSIADLHKAKIIIYSYPIQNPYTEIAPFWQSVVGELPNPYTTLTTLSSMGTLLQGGDKANQIKFAWPNLASIYGQPEFNDKTTQLTDWDFLIVLDQIPDRLLLDLMWRGDIELFQFDDLESVAQRNKFLKLYKYPKATYSNKLPPNWAQDKVIPSSDLMLLTFSTSLSIKSSLDSSLIELLTDAVEKASKRQIYLDKRYDSLGFLGSDLSEFPKYTAEDTFKANPVAKRYYRDGPSYLSELLTPTTASFIAKIALLLIPLLTVIYPIAKFSPRLYANHIKNKISGWYKKLADLEIDFKHQRLSVSEFLYQLSQLEDDLAKIKIPFLYRDFVQDLYIAREHLNLIESKVRAANDQ